jgi:hypothetical protein
LNYSVRYPSMSDGRPKTLAMGKGRRYPKTWLSIWNNEGLVLALCPRRWVLRPCFCVATRRGGRSRPSQNLKSRKRISRTHDAIVASIRKEAGHSLAPDASAIRDQLKRLLAHPLFANSKRYPVFLAYTVEQTLLGNASELKERTIYCPFTSRSLSPILAP